MPSGGTTLKIAEALKSAGESLAEIEIGGDGRDPVEPRTHESAEKYLEQAEKLGKELCPGDPGHPAHLDTSAQDAMKLIFRCKLIRVDLILGRAERDPKDKDSVALIEDGEELCDKAQKILDEYSHRFPDDIPRDHAALSIRRARCCLLRARRTGDEADYDDASRCLDTARAEAYVGRGEEDIDLMAEIHLQTAVGLSERAERRLSALKQAVGRGAGVPDFQDRISVIRDPLDRARVQLEQARSALSGGHFHFRRWCLWETLRRRCDACQVSLVELLLAYIEGLLLAAAKSPFARDSTTLEHIKDLLRQSHTALSISPPSHLLWAEWNRIHAHFMDLAKRLGELLEGSRPSPEHREMNGT
jgi:hypothetical protein